MERGAEMLRNTLKRQARADYLRRLENSARTVADYHEVVDMYDKLDANRERRERYHEIRQSDYAVQYTGSKRNGYRMTYTVKEDKPLDAEIQEKPNQYMKKESSKNYVYSEGVIIPLPLCHPYWQELMRGDFINYIYDNALEMWQILGDWKIGRLLRYELTAKQKETLFLSAVRHATTEQIGCYTDKSDRAVRRLLAAAFDNIRKPLARMTRKRLEDGLPVTHEKRCFLEWYEQQQQQQIEQKEKPGELPDGK
jgi:hypothetical protein